MATPSRISIIITVYNRLEFLDQAIASAVSQTQPAAEILVVDDGSHVEIRGHLAKHNGRVHYFRRENGGPAAARNTGLRECRGDHVLFLDDDDCLNDAALENLSAALAATPGAAWAVGGYEYVDATGRSLGRKHVPAIREGGLFAQMIGGNPVGAPLAVLLEKRAVLAAGGFDEDRRLQTAEDHDLWMTLSRTFPIAATPAIIACYRKHPNNATKNQSRHLEARLALLAKHRTLSNPQFSAEFDTAEAEIFREFGDVCYLSGRHSEARRHWRKAAKGGRLKGKKRWARVVKSLLPPPALAKLRK